jgi:hypothetical protein
MLAYLAYIAKSRNCGRVEWWVLDWNNVATSFYKRIDARPMDEWTVYRLIDKPLNRLAALWTG